MNFFRTPARHPPPRRRRHPRPGPAASPRPGEQKALSDPLSRLAKGSRWGRAAGRNGNPLHTLLRGPSASSAASRPGGQPRLWARRCTRRGRGRRGRSPRCSCLRVPAVIIRRARLAPGRAGRRPSVSVAWDLDGPPNRRLSVTTVRGSPCRSAPPNYWTPRTRREPGPGPGGEEHGHSSFSRLVQRPRPDTGPSGARRGCDGSGEPSGAGSVPACWPRTVRSCARAAPTWLRA